MRSEGKDERLSGGVIRRNTEFVNVGTDHDTGAFAVASIRGWWRHEGAAGRAIGSVPVRARDA